MEISASEIGATDAYHLMTSVIVPRPIAWVSSANSAGVENLAPFSYFSGLGSSPMMLTLGIANVKDREKDTLRNLKETNVFCVNLVEKDLIEEMNASSFSYGAEESEFAALDLESVSCVAIDGVRVKRARVALECKLVDVHVYGAPFFTNLVVAEVVHVFLHDEVCLPGRAAVDPSKVSPLARLGGKNYAELSDAFPLARPTLVEPFPRR
ncbi:MAG: flavin reductase family protein [Deltaproteobacteria bacterium]|nr:flavin reductase family protein [Deltaproteobacteria bacterium]